MNIEILTSILSDTLRTATPLILAGLGELISQKAGVLNLGVEGMMLVGAVSGFIAAEVRINITQYRRISRLSRCFRFTSY
jgi:simple sugar transport system permease protein